MSFVDKFKAGKKEAVKTESAVPGKVVKVKKAIKEGKTTASRGISVLVATKELGLKKQTVYNLISKGILKTKRSIVNKNFVVIDISDIDRIKLYRANKVLLKELIGALADYAEVEPTKWKQSDIYKEAIKLAEELKKFSNK